MQSYKNNITKLILIFMSFSLVLSISLYYIENIFFKHNPEIVALDNAVKKTKEREGVIKSFLHQSQQTLQSIRVLKSFNDYLKNGSNKEQLEDIFLSYAISQPMFMQLRYIDKDGLEKIRIDRNDSSPTPYIIPKNSLQNKANRYYFEDSKSKELDRVWFSALDLNMERGKVEKPYRPTIRAILPIKNNNKFDGILIINYLMKDFLYKFARAPLYDMILFDDRGYTLYHHDLDKSWSFYANPRFTIAKEYPNHYKDILSKPFIKSDHFVSRKLDTDVYGGLNLLLKLNSKYIQEQNKKSHDQNISRAIVIVLLSILLTYLVVKFFSKTLLNLDEINELNYKLNNSSHIAGIGFWEYHVNDDSIECSEGLHKILDVKDCKEHIGFDRFLSIVDKDEQYAFKKEIKASIKERRDLFFVHSITTNKGEKKYLEQRARHFFDTHDKHIKTIGSAYDITNRYLSDKKYKSIMEFASDGIHILDIDGNIVECSDSFAKNLGYTPEEVKKLNVKDWDSSIDKDILLDTIKSLMQKDAKFETKHKRKDGTIIDVQISAKGIELNSHRYLYASQRDVTEEKKLTLATQKNELRLQKLIELNKIAHTLTEKELCEKALDIAVEITDSKIGYLHSINDDQNHITLMSWNKETLKHCKAAYDNHYPIEKAGIWADAARYKKIVVHNDYATEQNKKGLPTGHFEVIRHMSAPVVEYDKVKMIVGVGNKDSYYTKLDESLLQATADDIEKMIAKKRAENLLEKKTHELEQTNQKLRENEDEIRIINENLEEMVKDKVAQIREKEQLLIQQSKLATMGEMIGNIAHQWRQPLNVISIKKDLLVDDYYEKELDDKKVDQFEADMDHLVNHMSKTIDDFRNFFIPSKEKMSFDIIESLDAVINIVEAQLKNHSISLNITNHSDNRIYLDGYPNEFKQVIINLISNAKDAILKRKESKEIRKGYINIDLYKDEKTNALEVVITDNGGGIPQDIIDKVFEPYFTTKFQSQGTGLGLYMSKTIIETNMQGSLIVQNHQDGARFSIKLKGK
jgi:PAS domain S-box-containing protein